MLQISVLISAALALTPAAQAQTSSPSSSAVTSDPSVPLLTPDTLVASMPRWSEFPVPPKTVTPLSEFAARVAALNKTGAQLSHDEAQIQWPTITPEALRSDIMARLNPAKMAPIDKPMSQADIEAYAARLRAKAAPPPVVP